jgi:hypothetical protein
VLTDLETFVGGNAMQEDREKWMELCARADDEQDPKKMALLILEINYILEAKERQLLKVAQSRSSRNNSRSPLESKSQ